MKRGMVLFSLAGVLLPLAGCSSLAIGMFNGFSKNPMSKLIVVKYPEIHDVVPYVTRYEYSVILRMAKSCQAQISPEMSSPAESFLASGIVYGSASAIGVGLGSLFLPGTILKNYAGYGAAAGALPGGVYGLIMWSYNDVSTVASCARDFVHKAGLLDIFIYPAYVRAEHKGMPGSSSARSPAKKKSGIVITIPTNAGESFGGETNSPPEPPP